MKCPRCNSTQISKNGRRNGKQNYLCKQCNRQFLESYETKGYSDDTKIICLRMHENGMGFREIERVTGINHNTIIQWVKQSGNTTSESSASEALDDDGLDKSSHLHGYIEYQDSRTYLRNLFNQYLLKNSSFTQLKHKFLLNSVHIKIFKIIHISLVVPNSVLESCSIGCNHEFIMQS
jgi:transposase-like protein